MQAESKITARDRLTAPTAVQPRKRKRGHRAAFLTWLRRIHLYVGLWGALLGLLFGATGILMNHRAIMKLPVTMTTQKTVLLPLPERTLTSPEDMANWLQQELRFTPLSAPQTKSHSAMIVIWADRKVLQPEHWTVSMTRPEGTINAEYVVGNRFVKLDRTDATPVGTLARLHTASGVNAFWVLLSDTIAGGMILLSITGLLLWSQLHTVRTMTVLASVGALLAATSFLWSTMAS